ncbi:MAG TPA: GcrA family cell cycle regulator [Allosphingosinicella sp.]|jgi:GcrA cell cycle regulator|uniref:GcrA family cell cycle regulator n=1 Tax=Allosphingosinicella sp. TaxID=2823234 RepID=UPI002F2A3596
MSWTDERIERLKELWSQGMTASQIAEELGTISRNAVIGKAHRLGLQARPSPVKPNEPAPVSGLEVAPGDADPLESPPSDLGSDADEAAEPAAAAKAEPSAAPPPPQVAASQEDAPVKPPQVRVVSVGPGGFLRQGPGDQQQPIPPAPPRRLVPAKPSADVADKTSLLDLNEKICKWPLGHPGEPDFHFCGRPANPGFPYCVEHCGVAYQAQMPRRDRRPPPPLPFGGPRVR